ncbi:GNAT family N-acetyltransferase [Cohaesibacter celericrescens]|uniref:GNAT family N-acetyltransferase n=1 Tax=Cohaesibacter celericrescens TaxID=2067669 RepID=UPI003569178F
MIQYQIRTAIRSDFPAIAQLQANSWRHAYRNHLPASYLAERVDADVSDIWSRYKIKPQDVVLVARETGTQSLLGFVSVWCRPNAFIDNLHCDPAKTSNGIGTALMQMVFNRLRDQGHHRAWLSVLVGNTGALRFYTRLGARPGKVRREDLCGFPVEAQIMQWEHLPLSE